MAKYDAVIAGSGIGGLVTACYLAKEGLKVAMFEKESYPGGYCCSFKRKGFIFDACVDSLSGIAKGAFLRQILDELEVFDKVKFIEINPYRRIIFSDYSIDLTSDTDLYKKDLKKIFPQEALAIDKLFSLMEQIYNESVIAVQGDSVRMDMVFWFWMDKPFTQLVESCTKNQKLAAHFCSYCNLLGISGSEMSAVMAVNTIMSYVSGGAWRVEGGMSNLALALADKAKSLGAELYFGEKVDKFLIEKRKAYGLITDKGRRVESADVISDIDLKTALASMIPEAALNKERFEAINNLEVSAGFLVIYLGIAADLADLGLATSSGYYPGCDTGLLFNSEEKLSFGLSLPSLADKSLAPKASSVVVIHWPICYNTAYSKDLNQTADKIISQVSRYIPGIEEKILVKSIATPETCFRYTANFNGSACGWKQDTKLFSRSVLFRNLFAGFYQVGHWAGFGAGIIPAAMTGRRTAKHIINKC